MLVVAPDDVPDWWLVEVGPRPGGHHPSDRDRARTGDWVLAGTAVDLYLSLWNRTDAPGRSRAPGGSGPRSPGPDADLTTGSSMLNTRVFKLEHTVDLGRLG